MQNRNEIELQHLWITHFQQKLNHVQKKVVLYLWSIYALVQLH